MAPISVSLPVGWTLVRVGVAEFEIRSAGGSPGITDESDDRAVVAASAVGAVGPSATIELAEVEPGAVMGAGDRGSVNPPPESPVVGMDGKSASAATSTEPSIEGLLLRIAEALERIDARQAAACRPDFKSLSTRR